MSKITLEKSEQGSVIFASKSNPSEHGHLRLVQSTFSRKRGYVDIVTKRCIVPGTIKGLQLMIEDIGVNPKGILVIKELRESDLPYSDFAYDLNMPSEYKGLPVDELDSDGVVAYEKAISKLIKRTGVDAENNIAGVELTSKGERILRFTVWDETGEDVDTLVAHDNVAELKAFNALHPNVKTKVEEPAEKLALPETAVLGKEK